MRLRSKWIDAVRYASFLNAQAVLLGIDLQIRRPDLHAEFAGEEDRGDSRAAAEIEHALARLKVQMRSEALQQPQRDWPHRVLQNPAWVIGIGQGIGGVVHGLGKPSRIGGLPRQRARGIVPCIRWM